MDEGVLATISSTFQTEDKVIPHYKTPEEFDDEMQMNTVYYFRATDQPYEAKGTEARTLWFTCRGRRRVRHERKDIEKALLNPDADASVKTIKGFESNPKTKNSSTL